MQRPSRTLIAEPQPQAAQLIAAMFEHAPHGIAMADLSGRYVAANPAFLKLLGYSEQELRRKTIHDVTHPEDASENRRVFADMAAGIGDHIEFEKRYLRKDGRAVWVRNVVARVPGAEGEPRYVVAMVEDITLRRHGEAGGDPQRELREEKSLLEMAYKLQALARRLVEVEETERHRIAGELHDRVGQNLSALSINLDIALGLLPRDSLEIRVRLADSLALVEGTLQTIESLMADLRPPLLDEYGLSAALAHYLQGFAQRTGVRAAFDDPGELGRGVRREAAIALFRIAQEALANIAKHAEAGKVRVLLEKQGEEIVLEISDDGRGFDPGERLQQSTRWGVTSMQERAAAVGGYVQLESTPGAGATVRAAVPVEEAP